MEVLCTPAENTNAMSPEPGELTIDSGHLLCISQPVRKPGMRKQMVQGPGRLGPALRQLSKKCLAKETHMVVTSFELEEA